MNVYWTLIVAAKGYKVGDKFRLDRITNAGWQMIDADGKVSWWSEDHLFKAGW